MKRLCVHLENQQPVFLFENTSVEEALEYAGVSELLAFFRYNTEHPETNIPYIKFPGTFIYEKRSWRLRKQGSSTIGRVQSIHPSAGEVFYLRMLLVDTSRNYSAEKNPSKILGLLMVSITILLKRLVELCDYFMMMIWGIC